MSLRLDAAYNAIPPIRLGVLLITVEGVFAAHCNEPVDGF
jgi:hypothetical protein